MKKRPEVQWLDIQKAWFIPYERLGEIEPLLNDAFGDGRKRNRQAACRNLVRVLKGLKLIPEQQNISFLSFGTLISTGERGLLISCTVGTQLRNF